MAAPGDMVEFTFMSQNHTLTQSTFPKPCVKMQGGADSGFLSNPNNTISPPPTFMFQVKDTKPACERALNPSNLNVLANMAKGSTANRRNQPAIAEKE